MTVLSVEKLSVAPMMEWTDRHFRCLMRQITKKTTLYSEMVPVQAVVFGNFEKFLKFNPIEKPLVLQFGGSSPELLAKACQTAKAFDYDAINLNAGCPSERVAAGNFGAKLMAQPALVQECLAAMIENSAVPVTIKTRIALEEETAGADGFDALASFTEKVRETGVRRLIVHARKARLNLSPKQNRQRPELRYDLVYDLKKAFPDMSVILNGGIESLSDAAEHLEHVDGAMVGRAAYANPYLFAAADSVIFGENVPVKTRRQVIEGFLPYIESELTAGTEFKNIAKQMFGVFKGVSGAALWRRELTEKAHISADGVKTVAEILNKVISSDIL